MRGSEVMESPVVVSRSPSPTRRRSLAAACLAHALHDGYTDQLYAVLPVWRSEFALSYAGLAVVRTLYFGTMGLLQLPADRMTARRLGPRAALASATLVAAAGFAVMATSTGFASLCLGLVVAGIGSSVQHPRASVLVSDAYGADARGPLGLYNFSGDMGKAVFPAAVALLLPVLAWRHVIGLMAAVGLAVGVALMALVPRRPQAVPAGRGRVRQDRGSRRGFRLLLAIGALDTAPRMGYLLFLPFLVRGRGGTDATVGVALAMLFVGGALGKATCGWLGDRLGIVWTVVVTETATALLLLATLALPLWPTLVLLPLLGVVLNGTSSVLYGTVPELAPAGDAGRAFAVFYTSVIAAGAFAPILYGVIADHAGRTAGIAASALTATAIIPLVLGMRPVLSR